MLKKFIFAATLTLGFFASLEISPSQTGSHQIAVTAGHSVTACIHDPECRGGTLRFP